MVKFEYLNDNEKYMFNTIDRLFINHNCIDQKSFLKILSCLVIKYKNNTSLPYLRGEKNIKNAKNNLSKEGKIFGWIIHPSGNVLWSRPKI